MDGLTGEALQFELIGKAFASIDDIEAVQYAEIARGRVGVIGSFTALVDADAKERVIQSHLFDHLWLLDTSWERASTNERIEESVTKEFAKIEAGLTEDEKSGRLDIRYRTAAGKHIIIELKRYSVVVGTHDLGKQIGKYRAALQKCLETQFPTEPQAIECIAVLGKFPDDLKPEEVERTLAGTNTRIVTYDTLIANAQRSYGDYLEKHVEVTRLSDLIGRLESSGDPAPAPDAATDLASPESEPAGDAAIGDDGRVVGSLLSEPK